ncbi:hypothetical protein CHUAL_006610 [Chamberlinius hualienensis]
MCCIVLAQVSIVLAYLIVAWSKVRASVGRNLSFNVVSYADDVSFSHYNHDNKQVIISTPPPVIWKIRLIDQLRSGQFVTENKHLNLPQSNFDVKSFNLALREHTMPLAKHLKVTKKVQPGKFVETFSSRNRQRGKAVLKIWSTTSTTKRPPLSINEYDSSNASLRYENANILQNQAITTHETLLKLSNDLPPPNKKLLANADIEKVFIKNKIRKWKMPIDMKLHFYQKLLSGYNYLNQNSTTPQRKQVQHLPVPKTKVNNSYPRFIPLNRLTNSSVLANYVFSVPHFDSVSHRRDWPRNPPIKMHQFRRLQNFIKPINLLPPVRMISPNFPHPSTLIRCRNGMVTTLLNIHMCRF